MTPAFFARVPPVVLHDALAEFLGASSDGRLEYRYGDAVKLAGHSCPTVAGAWLMTAKALARLYPGTTPERGAVRVEMRGAASEGTVGVTAAVAGWLTGAAGEGGFKGLAGRFGRRGLLAFGAPIAGEIRFTRVDTGASVEATFHASAIPAAPDFRARMARALAADALREEREALAAAWQERVARMLLEHRDDPRLVSLAD